jgi:EpsI family protein
MKLIPMRALLVLLAMLLATGLSVAAKPRTRVADEGPKIDLEQIVPKAFGEWAVDERVVPVLPSPEQQALLSKLYNQTLARTYLNDKGERIMLSIAYGGDQSDSMQVHRPEVCYAAQGFQILSEMRGLLQTQFGSIPVKRLVARQGGRIEPITYWVTVGDKPTYPGLRQKLVQLTYGLTGKIPDGMLIRVSSIDRRNTDAYELQVGFVRDLIASLDIDNRKRLIGAPL